MTGPQLLVQMNAKNAAQKKNPALLKMMIKPNERQKQTGVAKPHPHPLVGEMS